MKHGTNQALQRHEQQSFSLVPRDFREAMEFATTIAKSDLVPKDYRGKPANVLVAVQMGSDLNLQPMQALQSIAVINGRACLWGDGMLAVVQGHRDWGGKIEPPVDESTMTATCIIKRRGQPDTVRTFSQADAETAGLWGREGPWRTHPKRMLQMRARSFALRDAFADALRGIGSADEMSDVVDAKTGETTERPTSYIDVDSYLDKQDRPDVASEEAANKENSCATDVSKITHAFEAIGIPSSEIERFIQAPMSDINANDISRLREAYGLVTRGAATWDEIIEARHAAAEATRHGNGED